MKLFKSVLLVGLVVAASSCASYKQSNHVSPLVAAPVETHQLRADLNLDVNNKVEANSTRTTLFGFRIKGDKKFAETGFMSSNLAKAKSAAMYKAIEQGNYDIIAAPKYKYESHSWFFGMVKKYKVVLNGYGATIKDIKQVPVNTTKQIKAKK